MWISFILLEKTKLYFNYFTVIFWQPFVYDLTFRTKTFNFALVALVTALVSKLELAVASECSMQRTVVSRRAAAQAGAGKKTRTASKIEHQQQFAIPLPFGTNVFTIVLLRPRPQ